MASRFPLVSMIRSWAKGRRPAIRRYRPALEALEDRAVPANLALDFSTYLGGNMFEHARDITTDGQGNVYVTGGTESANFPTTPGAYQTVHNPGTPSNGSISRFDVFVTKFSSSGQLLWSTLIGGPNYDRAYAIEVDNQGFVYVAGRAGAGFPVSAGAFQTSFQGGQEAAFYGPQDGFIAKLSPDGSQLLWASYFGTSDIHIIRDIAIDSSGNVYLGSGYRSGTWTAGVAPTFQQGFQKTPQGNKDTVVAKVAADGSRVLWATYLGGALDDGVTPSVRVDAAGNVLVASSTTSTNMPTSAYAYDRSHNGGQDLYVAKLSADGGSLLYGTYLGGSGDESLETHNIAIDAQGNAYVTTGTTSANFPTTPGAFDRTFTAGGYGDIIAAKLSADGTQLLAGTFIGGSAGDYSQGIGLDSQGNVYISAGSHSTDFPVTPGAFQTAHAGGGDAVAIKLAADFSRLDYATFLGGSGDDEFRTAHVDSAGNFYLAGQTTSGNLPTRNAVWPSYGGNVDTMVAKFSPVASGTPPTVVTPAAATPATVTGKMTSLSVLGSDDGGEANLTYTWLSSGPTGVTFSANGSNTAKNIVATFGQAGTYSFQVTLRDAGGLTATSSVSVTVSQTLTSITVTPASSSVTVNQTQQFTASAHDQFGNALANQPAFTWSVSGGGTISGSGLFTAGATSGGPFTVTASSGGRNGMASVWVVAQSVNLLSDPGFENNGQGWQKTTFGGRSVTTAQAHSGTRSQQMLLSYQYDREVYQDVAVAAGASYDAAGWLKTSGVGGAGSSISLVWVNSAGTTLRTDVLGTRTGTNEWARLAGRYTAPTGAVTARFRLYTAVDPDNTGAAWFDDLELIQVVTGNQVPTVASPATVTPGTVTGNATSLNVLGADDAGEANLTYTWSSSGPAGVTFSANGSNAAKNTVVTFGQAGTYSFQVTIRDAGGLTAISNVNATVSQTLTSITVTPASPSVTVNQTQQFIASARDQFGGTLAAQPEIVWSVSGGGTISGNGLFTGGAAAGGPFTVTASAAGRSGTANVTVTPAPVSNLLSDASFDGNGSGWQKTTYGGRSVTTTQAHSGTRSQQMLLSYQYDREVYQDVAVAAGASYDAAGWLKTSGVGGAGSSISLIWMNADGAVLRTDVLGTRTGTNEWVRLANRYTAPTGAVTARFRLYTAVDPDNTGAAWFDDLELVRVG